MRSEGADLENWLHLHEFIQLVRFFLLQEYIK